MAINTLSGDITHNQSEGKSTMVGTPVSVSSERSWKTNVNAWLRKALGVEVRRVKAEECVAFSKHGKNWDSVQRVDGWIGGRYEVENHSKGYHGILKQWWEQYNRGSSCMLVSENNKVKSQFQLQYPDWSFVTLDKFDNLGEPVDIKEDLCGKGNLSLVDTFDLIICQATLEHVCDPVSAVRNMIAMLKSDGVVIIHTHTPSFPYHAYPRDYFRFQLDWFYDIPQLIPRAELLELLACKGHVFSAFRKTE